ncbi:MAG: esterase [Flavobacteriaceae bacterium]
MNQTEIEVSYSTINTYTTKNKLTKSTENIWMAFHGLGYLSRYFIENFNDLDKTKNYIIAPQAPSKYYQGQGYKYVGASWLTKENTLLETQNVLNYTKAVAENENLSKHSEQLIVFGFSQGVSIALRWIAAYQISCKAIVIHSGGIPKELTADRFSFLSKTTPVYLIYGTQDEYLTKERIKTEKELAHTLFGSRLKILTFEGKHQVNKELINKISSLNIE